MNCLNRIFQKINPQLVLICSALLFVLLSTTTIKKHENVIQINLNNILNARSVSTLTNNKITTWTKGIDGNGTADGYLTMSASLFAGDKSPKALPDNPLFPANEKHPEVLLHYSNSDSVSNQTIAVVGVGAIGFEVPSAKYSKLFLAVTSSEGISQITVNLQYADGSVSKSFEIPDYYADIQPNDPNICYLAHDLAKWGKMNKMIEQNHHNIDLLNIHPDQNRILKHIQVEKSKAAYLVLWAATGITFNN
jgi:hypothetical protein